MWSTDEILEFVDGIEGADDNLKKFLTDERYGTKDLANYTKFLQEQGKALDLATIKTKALAMAGNLLIDAAIATAITLVVKGLDALIHAEEKQRQKLEEARSKYQEIQSELQSVQSELETTGKRIDELNAKDNLTFVEQEELNRLKETNDELERQQHLLEAEEKVAKRQQNEEFVKTADKDINGATEYQRPIAGGRSLKKWSASWWLANIGSGGSAGAYISEAEYIEEQFEELEKLREQLSNASTLKEQKRIQKQINAINDYFVERSKQWQEDSKDIDYIKEPSNEDEEKVNYWLDFINDFRDRMAIAMSSDHAKDDALNRILGKDEFSSVKTQLDELGESGELTGEKVKEVIDSADSLYDKLVSLGVVSVDDTDWFDGLANSLNKVQEEAEAVTASFNLESFNKSIDGIQSAYDSFTKSVEEYNEHGALSLDTVQSLLALEPQYLAMLIDENGQLKLNEQAMYELVNAQLEEAKSKIFANGIAELNALAEQKAGEASENAASKRANAVTDINAETNAVKLNTEAELINAAAKAQAAGATKEEVNAVIQKVTTQVSTLESAVGGMKIDFGGVVGGFDKAGKSADKAAKKQKDAAKKVKDAAKAVKDAEKKIKDAEDKITDIQEKFVELDKQEHLEKLKYDIKTATEYLNQFSQALDRLKDLQDLTFDLDFTSKLQIAGQQFLSAATYGGEMRQEMEKLLTTQPQTADEAEELASRLENLSKSFFDNEKKIIEYRESVWTTLADYNKAFAKAAGERTSNAQSLFDDTTRIMKHGSLSGGFWSRSLLPSVSQSAVEKQRKENDELIAEEERYQNAVAKVRKQATDMAKTEADEKREKERAKYQKELEEAYENLQEAKDGLAEAQESYQEAVNGADEATTTATSNMSNGFSNVSSRVDKLSGKVDELAEKFKNNDWNINARINFNVDGVDIDAFANGEGPRASKTTTPKGNQKSETLLNWKNVDLRSDGGIAEGLTMVNEGEGQYAGQEAYVGKDRKLHLIEEGAQLADLPKGTKIINAKDLQEIVKHTGNKYFNEPIDDLKSISVDKYATGNTSVNLSAPTFNSLSTNKTKDASGNSAFDKVAQQIIDQINKSFENLKDNISFEPVKEQMISSMQDSEFSSQLSSAVTKTIGNAIDNTENEEAFSDSVHLLIIQNSCWEDITTKLKTKFEELGATASTWTEWINKPENALQAFKLENSSWSFLDENIKKLLNEYGVNGKAAWDSFVSSNPMQALQLLTSSWDALKQQIQQYMDDCVAIATTGAEAVHAVQIEAPDISKESWDNLQTLIANKIQEIIDTINDTFGDNTVDLNFQINASAPSVAGDASFGEFGTDGGGAGGKTGVISAARSQIGYAPGINASNKFSGWALKGSGNAAQAWCADFASWCLAQAGYTGIKSSSVAGLRSQTKATSSPKVGDLAMRGNDHVEIVSKVNSDGTVTTIGGNTGKGEVKEHVRTNWTDYRTYATGSSGAEAGEAWLGDEGVQKGDFKHAYPELVFQKKTGKAYLAGINGAEIVRLGKGDTVIPYEQTLKMLKGNTNASFNAYAKGVGNIGSTGTRIDVPSGLGTVSTYMHWRSITLPDSLQYKLRGETGEHYNSEGFATVNGRLVLAMTNTFGGVGDYVDVHLTNGRVIQGIIGDLKDQTWAHGTPANHWGHHDGKNVVEFVMAPGYNGGNPPLGAGVAYVENLGNYWGNPTFSGGANGSFFSNPYTEKYNEVIDKLQKIAGTWKTNTHTAKTIVKQATSRGNARGNYNWNVPFTTRKKGGIAPANTIVQANEGNKPEATIDENGNIVPLGDGRSQVFVSDHNFPVINHHDYELIKKYGGDKRPVRFIQSGLTKNGEGVHFLKQGNTDLVHFQDGTWKEIDWFELYPLNSGHWDEYNIISDQKIEELTKKIEEKGGLDAIYYLPFWDGSNTQEFEFWQSQYESMFGKEMSLLFSGLTGWLNLHLPWGEHFTTGDGFTIGEVKAMYDYMKSLNLHQASLKDVMSGSDENELVSKDKLFEGMSEYIKQSSVSLKATGNWLETKLPSLLEKYTKEFQKIFYTERNKYMKWQEGYIEKFEKVIRDTDRPDYLYQIDQLFKEGTAQTNYVIATQARMNADVYKKTGQDIQAQINKTEALLQKAIESGELDNSAITDLTESGSTAAEAIKSLVDGTVDSLREKNKSESSPTAKSSYGSGSSDSVAFYKKWRWDGNGTVDDKDEFLAQWRKAAAIRAGGSIGMSESDVEELITKYGGTSYTARAPYIEAKNIMTPSAEYPELPAEVQLSNIKAGNATITADKTEITSDTKTDVSKSSDNGGTSSTSDKTSVKSETSSASSKSTDKSKNKTVSTDKSASVSAPNASSQKTLIESLEDLYKARDENDSKYSSFMETWRKNIIASLESQGLKYDNIISFHKKEIDNQSKEIKQFSRTEKNLDALISETDNAAEKQKYTNEKVNSIDKQLKSYSKQREEYEQERKIELERQAYARQWEEDTIWNTPDKDQQEVLNIYSRDVIESFLDADGKTNNRYSEAATALVLAGKEYLVEPFNNLVEELVKSRELLNTSQKTIESIDDNIDTIDDNVDSLSDKKDDISLQQSKDKTDLYTKLITRENEIYELRKNKQDEITNSMEKRYALNKSIREEQARIDEDLKANKHLNEWLDEDTRKLLFNDADYDDEMKALREIQNESERLTERYQSDINDLGETEYYQQKQITAEYERQMSALNDKLEDQKKLISLKKKELEYENALKERDTQIILGNRVVNVADPEKLYNLAKERATLESDYKNALQTHKENEEVRESNRLSDSINEEILARQKLIELINNSSTDTERKMLAAMLPDEELLRMIYASLDPTNWRWMNDHYNEFAIKSYEGFTDKERSVGYDANYIYDAQYDAIQDLFDKGLIDSGLMSLLNADMETHHNMKSSSLPYHDIYDQTRIYGGQIYDQQTLQLDEKYIDGVKTGTKDGVIEALDEVFNNKPLVEIDGNFINEIERVIAQTGKDEKDLNEIEDAETISRLRELYGAANFMKWIGAEGYEAYNAKNSWGAVTFDDIQPEDAEKMLKWVEESGLLAKEYTEDQRDIINNGMAQWATDFNRYQAKADNQWGQRFDIAGAQVFKLNGDGILVSDGTILAELDKNGSNIIERPVWGSDEYTYPVEDGDYIQAIQAVIEKYNADGDNVYSENMTAELKRLQTLYNRYLYLTGKGDSQKSDYGAAVWGMSYDDLEKNLSVINYLESLADGVEEEFEPFLEDMFAGLSSKINKQLADEHREIEQFRKYEGTEIYGYNEDGILILEDVIGNEDNVHVKAFKESKEWEPPKVGFGKNRDKKGEKLLPPSVEELQQKTGSYVFGAKVLTPEATETFKKWATLSGIYDYVVNEKDPNNSNEHEGIPDLGGGMIRLSDEQKDYFAAVDYLNKLDISTLHLTEEQEKKFRDRIRELEVLGAEKIYNDLQDAGKDSDILKNLDFSRFAFNKSENRTDEQNRQLQAFLNKVGDTRNTSVGDAGIYDDLSFDLFALSDDERKKLNKILREWAIDEYKNYLYNIDQAIQNDAEIDARGIFTGISDESIRETAEHIQHNDSKRTRVARTADIEVPKLREEYTLQNIRNMLEGKDEQTTQYGAITMSDVQKDYSEAIEYVNKLIDSGKMDLSEDNLKRISEQIERWGNLRAEKMQDNSEYREDVIKAAEVINSGGEVLKEGFLVGLSDDTIKKLSDIFTSTDKRVEIKDGKIVAKRIAAPNKNYVPDVPKYASGTKSAKDGLAVTDEEGYELKLRKLPSGKYTVLKDSDMIFSSKQADNLWELSKNSIPSLQDMVTRNLNMIQPLQSNVGNTTSISYNFGDIVLSQVLKNGNEFIHQLKDNLRDQFAITQNLPA